MNKIDGIMERFIYKNVFETVILPYAKEKSHCGGHSNKTMIRNTPQKL